MANPQLENGHTDIAHELLEAILKLDLSGQQFRVLLAIIRKLYGWHKKEDWVSNKQVSDLTGITPKYCSRAIQYLVSRNILTILKNEEGIARMIRFNKDFHKWIPSSNLGIPSSKLRTTLLKIEDSPSSNLGIPTANLDSADAVSENPKDTITKENTTKPINTTSSIPKTKRAASKPQMIEEEYMKVMNSEFSWLVDDLWNIYAPEHLRVTKLPDHFTVNQVFAARANIKMINLSSAQWVSAVKNYFTQPHWYADQGFVNALTIHEFLKKHEMVRKMAFLKSSESTKRSEESRRLSSNYGNCEDDAPLAEA